MDAKDSTQQEAEYAGFVDRATQVVLEEAIKKVVDAFSQTDTLEHILGYLETMQENIQNIDERVKQLQQREKQVSDKAAATEISLRNLLQRIQTMEVQMEDTSRKVAEFKEDLRRLTTFFEKAPLARMFSRLKSKEEAEESDVKGEVTSQPAGVRPKYGKPLPRPEVTKVETSVPPEKDRPAGEVESQKGEKKEADRLPDKVGSKEEEFPLTDDGETESEKDVEGEEKE